MDDPRAREQQGQQSDHAVVAERLVHHAHLAGRETGAHVQIGPGSVPEGALAHRAEAVGGGNIRLPRPLQFGREGLDRLDLAHAGGLRMRVDHPIEQTGAAPRHARDEDRNLAVGTARGEVAHGLARPDAHQRIHRVAVGGGIERRLQDGVGARGGVEGLVEAPRAIERLRAQVPRAPDDPLVGARLQDGGIERLHRLRMMPPLHQQDGMQMRDPVADRRVDAASVGAQVGECGRRLIDAMGRFERLRHEHARGRMARHQPEDLAAALDRRIGPSGTHVAGRQDQQRVGMRVDRLRRGGPSKRCAKVATMPLQHGAIAHEVGIARAGTQVPLGDGDGFGHARRACEFGGAPQVVEAASPRRQAQRSGSWRSSRASESRSAAALDPATADSTIITA